jgi:hypothetical protein
MLIARRCAAVPIPDSMSSGDAEGELQAAEKLRPGRPDPGGAAGGDAASLPHGLQNIAGERSSTIVFSAPADRPGLTPQHVRVCLRVSNDLRNEWLGGAG